MTVTHSHHPPVPRPRHQEMPQELWAKMTGFVLCRFISSCLTKQKEAPWNVVILSFKDNHNPCLEIGLSKARSLAFALPARKEDLLWWLRALCQTCFLHSPHKIQGRKEGLGVNALDWDSGDLSFVLRPATHFQCDWDKSLNFSLPLVKWGYYSPSSQGGLRGCINEWLWCTQILRYWRPNKYPHR